LTPPAPPRLTGGGHIEVTKRIQTMVGCPKCLRPLDITDVRVGSSIECPHCTNVTWTPEYVPRWWYRARNYTLSLIGAFVVGVISSYVASYLWDQAHASKQVALMLGNWRLSDG